MAGRYLLAWYLPIHRRNLLKLKKIGKTTRPFMYDLNQIPYDDTVKVTNRFKVLDLINKMPEELWMEFQLSYFKF